MTTIASYADLHGQIPNKPFGHVDFAVFAGDILPHNANGKSVGNSGDFNAQRKFLFEQFIPFAKSFDSPVIFIAGNHDLILDFNKRKTRQFWYYREHIENSLKSAIEGSNVHYLRNESKVINGIKFYGTPYVPFVRDVWAFQYPQYSSTQFAENLHSSIPEDTDVLISHSPVEGVLDKSKGKNYGCSILRRYVQWKLNLKAFIHGHSHFRGIETHGDTIFVNGAISGKGRENRSDSNGNPYLIQSLDPIVVTF